MLVVAFTPRVVVEAVVVVVACEFGASPVGSADSAAGPSPWVSYANPSTSGSNRPPSPSTDCLNSVVSIPALSHAGIHLGTLVLQ